MGGGDGGAGKVAREQDRQEKARLAAIQSGISQTNEIYNSSERQGQYNSFLAAQRQQYFDELSRQQEEANRQNKFGLARSGMVGSRVAVDQGKDLGEAYSRGVVNADRLAQGSLADLMAADEDSRRSTIGLIQSGADATTASSAALRGLETNLAGAKAAQGPAALGQVFGSFADMYKRSVDRDAERRALKDRTMLYNTGPAWGFGG